MGLVEVSTEGPVAGLTLNRPDQRNALSVELCDAIVDALAVIGRGDAARVMIVRGAGGTFCSGADFAAVSGRTGLDFLPAFERMLEAVAGFELPTIAAIQGAALGGGLQLATVCDFRLATTDARLGIPSSRLGIVVNPENVERLVLLVGIATAKEVLMTGRTYEGEPAAAAGLINRAVPGEALDDEVQALAAQIASLAPLSVRGTKKAIRAVADHLGGMRSAHPDRVAEIDRLVAEAYASKDLAEGLRAMTEKRPPRFEGR